MDNEHKCLCNVPDKYYIYGFFATWVCKTCRGTGLDSEFLNIIEEEEKDEFRRCGPYGGWWSTT